MNSEPIITEPSEEDMSYVDSLSTLDQLSTLVGLPGQVVPSLPADFKLPIILDNLLQITMQQINALLEGDNETLKRCAALEADKIVLEQNCKTLEGKLAENSKLVSELKEKNDKLADLEEANKHLAGKFESQKHSWQAEADSFNQQITLLKIDSERLKTSHEEQLRALERKQSEVDSLTLQNEQLMQKLHSGRESTLKHDSSVIELQGKLSTANIQLSSAQKEVEKLNQQLKWTSSELDNVIAEFNNYRKAKSAELVKAAAEVEHLVQEVYGYEDELKLAR